MANNIDNVENGVKKLGSEERQLINNNEPARKKQKETIYLFVSAFTAALNLAGCGCSLVWTSPVIKKLQSEDPNVNPLTAPVSPTQVSLIAGVLWLGSMTGSIMGAHVFDRFGRKMTISMFGVLQIVSFIILAFATKIYIYYITRYLLGICFGVMIPGLTIFTSEIAETHSRGRYVSMASALLPFGSLYAYILGVFFSVKVFTILCAIPSLIGLVVFALIGPETPIYLVKKGNRSGAFRVLRKLRGREDVNSDISEIESFLKTSETSEGFNLKAILSNSVITKGLKIGIGMGVLQAFSGIVAIMAFLGPIFDSAGRSISGNSVAILVGVLKAFFFTFTSVVVEKLGRRSLMLISTISATITLFLLGFYFQFKDSGLPIVQYFWWLPIGCILGYMISYSLGIGCIIFVVLGEIFPSEVKSQAVSLVALLTTFSVALTTFSFPFIVMFLGIPFCFYIYGCCCCLGIVFIYFSLPETKGKTFLEIQTMLQNNR